MGLVISKILEHKFYIIFLSIIIFIDVVQLSPMINSGYINDDSLNSLAKGILMENNQSSLNYSLAYTKYWISEGRFFPLASILFGVFTLFDNLYLYKATILILTIINILIFGYFIKIITKSTALALFSIMLPPLLIQYRFYHDPVLSYNWFLQIVFTNLFSSLILLILYLRKRNKYFLYLSLFFCLINLLTYEITYSFYILYFFLIYFYSDKRNIANALKESSPFILLTVLVLLIPIFLRLKYGVKFIGGTSGEAYIANFNLYIYMATLIKQTYAAFPLSYFIIDPHNIFKNTFNTSFRNTFFEFVFIVIGLILLLMNAFKLLFIEFYNLKTKINKNDFKGLLVLGFFLLILPGVFISLSPKYQREVIWGVGYLPVYISYYGIATIIVAMVWWLFDVLKLSNKNYMFLLSILIATIFSCLGLLNYSNNKIVVEYLNSYWLYPRTIIEDGMRDGIFQNLNDNSLLLVDVSFPWANINCPWVNKNYSWWGKSAFYYMHSGVKLKYIGAKEKYLGDAMQAFESKKFDKYCLYEFPEKDNVFYLSFDSHSKNDGYVVLGKINNLKASNDKLFEAISESAIIYIRKPYSFPLGTKISVSGRWNDKNELVLSEPFTISEEQMTLISYGNDYKQYNISKVNKLIDLKSLSINIIQRVGEPSEF